MRKRKKSERLVWIDIMLTLAALETMAYFYYGVRILVLAGVCIAVSLAAELISFRLMHRTFTADDLTCTSDALITALMMPAVIEYKIPAIACVFAVIAAKNIFGGRINMIFSPAAAAYLFILTSWKDELLSYSLPYDKLGIFEKASGLVNSASYTYNHTGAFDQSNFELLMGYFSGPVGAVSILLLAVSAVILLLRRDISCGAFIGTLLGTCFMAYFCPISGSGFTSVKYTLATNMILFAAIYIVSDRRIAPERNYYAFFYGFFIAISSYVVTLTTGKENVIVIMSVLFTPVSLGFKNLQKRIDKEIALEKETAARSADITDSAAETIENITAEEAELSEEPDGDLEAPSDDISDADDTVNDAEEENDKEAESNEKTQ